MAKQITYGNDSRPTKVVRIALQNAASIASLLLTTEALISEIPEEKDSKPAGAGADSTEAERRKPDGTSTN